MSHINIDLQKGLSSTLKDEYKITNKQISRFVIQQLAKRI